MSLQQLIAQQFEDKNVSDMHLGVGVLPRVRKGSRIEVIADSINIEEAAIGALLASVIPDGNKPSLALAGRGDIDFAMTIGEHRVRGNLYKAGGAVRLALRRLDKEAWALDALGLPTDIDKLLDSSGGLLLVVGGTGSGKSTTLAAFVQRLNETIFGHIITLEHPIEIIHRSKRCLINQREVGPSADVQSFAVGLRSAMREDPDVLLIGEINDRETVDAAVKAAQTGHLVLASLHTNNCSETVERLLSFYSEAEQFLARSVISSTLRGVIAQKLVRGRNATNTMVCEVLRMVPSIRSSILDGNTNGIRQAMNTGSSDGQLTFNRSLAARVKDGSLLVEAALRESFDLVELKEYLK